MVVVFQPGCMWLSSRAWKYSTLRFIFPFEHLHYRLLIALLKLSTRTAIPKRSKILWQPQDHKPSKMHLNELDMTISKNINGQRERNNKAKLRNVAKGICTMAAWCVIKFEMNLI